MEKQFFSIELHDYIFGFLSIFSATGRFAWPVIYILLFFSTIYIYKNFGSFYSSVIIFFILLLQIFDISLEFKIIHLNIMLKRIMTLFGN